MEMAWTNNPGAAALIDSNRQKASWNLKSSAVKKPNVIVTVKRLDDLAVANG